MPTEMPNTILQFKVFKRVFGVLYSAIKINHASGRFLNMNYLNLYM